MDVFEYRASRTVNTEGVFLSTGNNTEIGGLFLRLKNVMTSELHLQWDIAFFEQYIVDHMVPRSLRWDIQPQQGESDIDSWFNYFNKAGIAFLRVLITKKTNRLASLDREIKELRDKLLTFKSSPEYNSLSSNLQGFLEKEIKDQKLKKQKKYSRDVGDYKNGTVFGWQKLFTSDPTVTTSLGVPPTPQTLGPHTSGTVDNRASSISLMSVRDARGENRSLQPGVRHYSPHTPTAPTRGRGHNRDKSGGRGQGSRSRYDSYHYDPDYPRDHYSYYRETPPVHHREHPNAHYPNLCQYREPSVSTYNRFSPLMNGRDSSFDQRDFHEQPPYGYNQTTQDQDFRVDSSMHRNGPNPREVQEGVESTEQEKEKEINGTRCF